QEVDLAALVHETRDILRSTLGAHVEISIDLPDGLWAVEADRNQLENALLNLAINSRDAMPQGGAFAIAGANTSLDAEYASAHPEAEPGDFVLLSVRDTGMGMAPEVLERATQPFFTTKDAGKGTGLGLSMVHGFVKQTGGHLSIDSEVGRGT